MIRTLLILLFLSMCSQAYGQCFYVVPGQMSFKGVRLGSKLYLDKVKETSVKNIAERFESISTMIADSSAEDLDRCGVRAWRYATDNVVGQFSVSGASLITYRGLPIAIYYAILSDDAPTSFLHDAYFAKYTDIFPVSPEALTTCRDKIMELFVSQGAEYKNSTAIRFGYNDVLLYSPRYILDMDQCLDD